ncbi:ATP-binding cassette domain-containing protein [Streptacidiphilus sp. EB103A]|uniref:ATP-binding cassette domain-containing protein n=1 Tax=Streptacidiphilus sp. EB103A TaxID=3156275 RepID=UPI003515207C
MTLRSDPRYEEIASASWAQMAADLPRTLGRAARLGWNADHRALLRMAAAQLAVALASALLLAASTRVFSHFLTAAGPTDGLGDRLHQAMPALAVTVTAAAVRALADGYAQATAARLAPKVVRAADTATLLAATRAALSAYDTPGFETALEASERGAEATQELITDSQAMVSALAQLTTATAVAALLQPILLPLILLAVIPRGIAAVAAARIEHRAAYRTLSDQRLRSVLRSAITDRKTAAEIRAATMADFLIDQYGHISDRIEAHNAAAVTHAARIRLLGTTGTGLGTGLAWTALAALAATGHVPLPVAGTALMALHAASGSLASAVTIAARLFRSSLYLQDWKRFLTLADEHRAHRGGHQLNQVGPTVIRAQNLTYTYAGADQPALKDINLTLHRGEVVALVGENGSGKTTLATLLTGLLQPTTGTVTWDSTDLANADPTSIWSHVGMVPQTYTRWPMACRENITLGQPRTADDQAVHDAAAAAGADTTIAALPEGLDTLLARPWWGGHDLSGGHWQRLAIARAFYRDPAVLILDEPTSALDARAENQVFTRLRALAAGRTTVFVTHRLANVRSADRIIVLDHGLIREQGTFDELLNQAGLFAELYKLQQDNPAS